MAEEQVDGLALLSKMLEENTDVLRDILASALARVMEAEVSALCGADYRSRTGDRQNSRNGYRERGFETRMGSIPLSIPKVREGSYFPSFLDPRRRWERAFVNVVAEAYVLGVSTRKVEDLVEAMGAQGMKKSEVSRMAKELDAQVDGFRNRPIDKQIPYLWLDALYIKVREGGRVVSKAVMVAYAVTEHGEREVLGVSVAHGEMEASWRAFLASLVERGLHGVMLVISDAHEGLRKAVRAVLNGVSWQRCSVHFLRNVLSHMPRKAHGFAAAAIKAIFQQPDRKAAGEAASRAIALLDEKYPSAAEVIRTAEDDVLAYMDFPEKHWRQLRSTNPLERLNKEIRRRTDVVGIFPNDAAVLRLVTMLLAEQNDEWAVGRRYFSEGSMAALYNRIEPPNMLEVG